jgi:hypothetical protein
LSNVINGWENPIFNIYNPSGVLIETIELPLTNRQGLVESYEIIKKQTDVINFAIKQKILGYRISFSLYYDEYVSGNALLDIKKIINHAKLGNKLVLIPRADKPSRTFEVVVNMDNFDIGLLKGGAKAIGHRLPVLQFTTKYLQAELGWSWSFSLHHQREGVNIYKLYNQELRKDFPLLLGEGSGWGLIKNHANILFRNNHIGFILSCCGYDGLLAETQW